MMAKILYLYKLSLMFTQSINSNALSKAWTDNIEKVSDEQYREFLLSGCSQQASDSLIAGDQSACTLW